MKFYRVKKISLFSFLFSLFFLLSSFSLFSLDFDFGLLTNQYVGFGNNNSKGDILVDYRGDILPRMSFLFGDTGSLIISAGLTFGYEEKDSYFVFELLDTAYAVSLGAFGLRLGRMMYSDPLTFIAEGLFDGVQLSHASPLGSFSLGAWYTGLLYKKTANIFMTDNDITIYADDAYFAPRRLLASLDWAHLSVMEILRLQAALSMQIDLNDTDEKLNSYYFTIKAGIPINSFLFELGGSIEAMQFNSDNSIALAWEAGIYWTLPTAFSSRLSLTGHSAGGKLNDKITAFVPVTAKYYGEIFQPVMSGITVLCLDYSARISQPFGASVNISYFVRNDRVTYKDPGNNNKGYFMGAEFFARLFWSPVSDVQFNLGAGMFVPSMGDAWKKDVKNQWHVDLTAVLALY